MSHKKLFIIAGAIAAAIVGIIYFDNTRRAQAPAEENNNAPTDETSDWKAYRNEDSGYEIQYPAGWTVSAWGKIAYFCGPLIQVCGPEPHDVKANVSVSVKGETGTLESYVQSPASGLEIVDEVELGGQKAYITGSVSDNFGKFIEKQVHVKHGDSIYEVTAYSEGYSKSEFDRILSTFKFIDSTGTSDWIIYRNEEYGFEFKYPNDWTHTIDYRGFDVCLREQGKDYYRDGAERCAVGLSIRNIGSNIKTISSIKGAYRASGLTYEESIRNIAGIQATMLGGTGGLEVYFTKDQMDFNFRVVDYINYNGVMEFDSAFAGVRDALMNILSTFKFIDS